MLDQSLRGTPMFFYQSLNRPFLMLGADRSLFFLYLGMSIIVALGQTLMSFILAGIVFTSFHTVAILIARSDYQMKELYLRNTRYRRYYAPQPGIHARIRDLEASVPVYQGKRGWV